MKAARIHAYGGPEVFRIEEAPEPHCGPRDLLIDVHAAAINPIDAKIRQGTQRVVIRKTMPTILGMDVSGVVAQVGAEVQGFEVGDEVFSSPTHSRQGCYAERVAIDARAVAHKPAVLSHVEAASIPLVGLTAWQCLVATAALQPAQRVMIEAGAGGVGSFAIQLAAHIGAEVATTCSPSNADLVRKLGATHVINYREENFDEVLPPQDVVLEAMGGPSKARALRALRRGGRLTSINSDVPAFVKRLGPLLGVVAAGARLLTLHLWSPLRHGVRFHAVVRSPQGQQLKLIAELLQQGAIRPLIDRVLPLEQVSEGHRLIEAGHARGKIVLNLRP